MCTKIAPAWHRLTLWLESPHQHQSQTASSQLSSFRYHQKVGFSSIDWFLSVVMCIILSVTRPIDKWIPQSIKQIIFSFQMFECVFPGLHYRYHHDHCYRPRLRSSYTPYCISTPHDRPFCPALQSDTTQCCQISNTFRRFFLDQHNEGSYNTTQLTVTLRCTNIQSLVVNQTQHALPDALCTRCTRRHETLHCQMHYVDALWLQTAFPGQLKIGERQAVCGGLTQDPFNSKYIAISDPTEHF